MSKLYVISVDRNFILVMLHHVKLSFSHAVIILFFFPAKLGILRIYEIHNVTKCLRVKIVTQITNTTLINSLREKKFHLVAFCSFLKITLYFKLTNEKSGSKAWFMISWIMTILSLWSLRVTCIRYLIQYHLRIKLQGLGSKGNDHQPKKLMIVEQILLVSTPGDEWRTFWRICTLMLVSKGLNSQLGYSVHFTP